MGDNNLSSDEDCSSNQKTVVLRDWWLIKCSIEFQGKRFGVAGTQIAETGAARVFTSSPIIKAFDVFTLQASDGVCIILRGFLNKQRLALSGFLPQISSEFIFGFPPCWESKCNHFFLGTPPSGAPFDKAASPTFLSPCNDKKRNLEGCPAERRVKSTVTAKKKNKPVETSDKDGHGEGSIARDDQPSTKKSLPLHSKSVELMSKVKNKTPNDNSKKITSKIARKESLTTEQRKGKLKVTKAYLSDSSSKPGNNGKSKKSEKILKGDSSKPTTHSRSKVKDNLSVGKTIRKIDFDEEVTPEKDAKKKQKTNNAEVSADSLGQKRSRSGRVLVSPLEYWRNQVPVYDLNRNLIQVKEGYQTNSTPSTGKGSVSRKPRR